MHRACVGAWQVAGRGRCYTDGGARAALLAARSLADQAAACGFRRAKILGRWVLQGLDETLRLPKQFKTVVMVLK